MIGKLRIKFVSICMALVTAVLLAVLCAVFFSLRQNLIAIADQQLRTVMQEEFRPGFSAPIEERSALLPYFTVEIIGGTAYVTGGTYEELENTVLLTDIISQCLKEPDDQGEVSGYGLRYLRQNRPFSQRIAFVDMSMEHTMLREMMGSYGIIALGALVVLLGISVLLSVAVTQPIAKAWNQQHQFLSDASHELKTPLTVILSSVELLQSDALPPAHQRWADNIHSEAKRMKTLVEEMLTLARADNAVSTTTFSQVDLSEVAMEAVLAFEPVAYEAGLTLQEDITPNAILAGDGAQLWRLLSILLDNAIKYSAKGGTVTLQLTKTDRQIRILVSNPGPPIPPQQLQRLFERFYRADASRGEQSGFGLGLPIASTIVSDHKGAIRAESDIVSTRFLVTLPIRR